MTWWITYCEGRPRKTCEVPEFSVWSFKNEQFTFTSSLLEACVSFVLLGSRLASRQEGPSLWTSLWKSDAYPAIPSKCRVETCLLMTTTLLCCRMDWWGNTQRTVMCSQPDHLSRFILQRVPPGTLLHCPQTKVQNFVRLIDKNYKDYDKHHTFVLIRGLSGSFLGHLAGFSQWGLYTPSSDW